MIRTVRNYIGKNLSSMPVVTGGRVVTHLESLEACCPHQRNYLAHNRHSVFVELVKYRSVPVSLRAVAGTNFEHNELKTRHSTKDICELFLLFLGTASDCTPKLHNSAACIQQPGEPPAQSSPVCTLSVHSSVKTQSNRYTASSH